MPNGDDEQNRPNFQIALPDDGGLRNRMRLQAALQSELDKKTDWLMQSEQDLLKIFRFYLVVLGAFISALSLLVVQEGVPLLGCNSECGYNALLNLYTASAIFFWVVAVVGAIVAYVVIWSSMDVKELQRGDSSLKLPDPADNQAELFSELELNDTLEQSPEDFEDEIIYNHIQSLRWTGNEFTKIRYPFLWGGMALVSISVLAFGFGIVHALSPQTRLALQNGWPRMFAGLIHAVGILVLLAGLVVSRFLLRQTVALHKRIFMKINSSEASSLPTEWGYLRDKIPEEVCLPNIVRRWGSGAESPTEESNGPEPDESADGSEESLPEGSTERTD